MAAFLRSVIPRDRKYDLEFKQIQGINIEVSLNGKKWLFLDAYKPSSLSGKMFETDCSLGLDKIRDKYRHNILL